MTSATLLPSKLHSYKRLLGGEACCTARSFELARVTWALPFRRLLLCIFAICPAMTVCRTGTGRLCIMIGKRSYAMHQNICRSRPLHDVMCLVGYSMETMTSELPLLRVMPFVSADNRHG